MRILVLILLELSLPGYTAVRTLARHPELTVVEAVKARGDGHTAALAVAAVGKAVVLTPRLAPHSRPPRAFVTLLAGSELLDVAIATEDVTAHFILRKRPEGLELVCTLDPARSDARVETADAGVRVLTSKPLLIEARHAIRARSLVGDPEFVYTNARWLIPESGSCERRQ